MRGDDVALRVPCDDCDGSGCLSCLYEGEMFAYACRIPRCDGIVTLRGDLCTGCKRETREVRA